VWREMIAAKREKVRFRGLGHRGAGLH
jgi:hypothetical protein